MEKKKIGLAVGLLVAALALSISLVTAKNTRLDLQDIEQTTFQVSNLSCGSCLGAIEEELNKYAGMVEMSADLGLGLVTVGHTSELAGPQIAEAITWLGYPARYVTAEQVRALQAGAAAGGAGRTGCGGGAGGGCGSGGCSVPPPARPERG